MSDSEDEVFNFNPKQLFRVYIWRVAEVLALKENFPRLEADVSYLDVGETVSNLFYFN